MCPRCCCSYVKMDHKGCWRRRRQILVVFPENNNTYLNHAAFVKLQRASITTKISGRNSSYMSFTVNHVQHRVHVRQLIFHKYRLISEIQIQRQKKQIKMTDLNVPSICLLFIESVLPYIELHFWFSMKSKTVMMTAASRVRPTARPTDREPAGAANRDDISRGRTLNVYKMNKRQTKPHSSFCKYAVWILSAEELCIKLAHEAETVVKAEGSGTVAKNCKKEK